MSADTATEQHANAKLDEEDLTTTKALTRGTQDINNGNVRCMEDPHMSFEASAKGTSAKCTETTTVILEGTLHETQTEPQDSLPLTLRLPIEGKPGKFKQEEVVSIVMAGHTNRMVKLAKPTETDMDINGKATLGREPVGMVHRVDEGGEEHESQSWLQ